MSEKNLGKYVSRKYSIGITIFAAAILLIATSFVPAVTAADTVTDPISQGTSCPLCAGSEESIGGTIEEEMMNLPGYPEPPFNCTQFFIDSAVNITYAAIDVVIYVVENTDWEALWQDVAYFFSIGYNLLDAVAEAIGILLDTYEEEIKQGINLAIDIAFTTIYTIINNTINGGGGSGSGTEFQEAFDWLLEQVGILVDSIVGWIFEHPVLFAIIVLNGIGDALFLISNLLSLIGLALYAIGNFICDLFCPPDTPVEPLGMQTFLEIASDTATDLLQQSTISYSQPIPSPETLMNMGQDTPSNDIPDTNFGPGLR